MKKATNIEKILCDVKDLAQSVANNNTIIKSAYFDKDDDLIVVTESNGELYDWNIGFGDEYVKCKYCENEAVYELNTHKGIINVCEECDEDFTICQVCGNAVPVEEARFVNPEDEYETCYKCVPIRDDE